MKWPKKYFSTVFPNRALTVGISISLTTTWGKWSFNLLKQKGCCTGKSTYTKGNLWIHKYSVLSSYGVVAWLFLITTFCHTLLIQSDSFEHVFCNLFQSLITFVIFCKAIFFFFFQNYSSVWCGTSLSYNKFMLTSITLVMLLYESHTDIQFPMGYSIYSYTYIFISSLIRSN